MGGSLGMCMHTHVETRGCHRLSWSVSIIYIEVGVSPLNSESVALASLVCLF